MPRYPATCSSVNKTGSASGGGACVRAFAAPLAVPCVFIVSFIISPLFRSKDMQTISGRAFLPRRRIGRAFPVSTPPAPAPRCLRASLCVGSARCAAHWLPLRKVWRFSALIVWRRVGGGTPRGPPPLRIVKVPQAIKKIGACVVFSGWLPSRHHAPPLSPPTPDPY